MTLVTVFTNVLAAPTTVLPQAATATTTERPTTPAAASVAHHTFMGVARLAIDVSSGSVYRTLSPAAPLSVSSHIVGAATVLRPRKRHSKRHSNWQDYYNENTTVLEWVNPCGGNYEPAPHASGRLRRKSPKEHYNRLKFSTGNEFKKLKNGQQAIDISNMEMWSLHNKTYKFLPKLKTNSTIALGRWYRNMQTYIGSFAYLLRVQLKWDLEKLQHASPHTARELNELLNSARSILCDLETTINGTQPAHRSGRRRLPQVTRSQMNKRLKLYTKRRVDRNPALVQEPNSIDLRWVKYYYYDFLKTMWQVLRKYTKRRGQVAIAQQRKEFNEVEKNFGSTRSRNHSKAWQQKSKTYSKGRGSSTLRPRFAHKRASLAG